MFDFVPEPDREAVCVCFRLASLSDNESKYQNLLLVPILQPGNFRFPARHIYYAMECR
jgi:hypothetical protein